MTCEGGPADAGGAPAETARRTAAAMWADDVASRALGMELVGVGPGRATVRMPVRPDMLQGHGTCHGGVLFALCDTAFAFACNSGGIVTVGSSADITWVTAAHAGDVLLADAVEVTAYGRSGLTRVTVTREDDGALVALFQGRSRSLGRAVGGV